MIRQRRLVGLPHSPRLRLAVLAVALAVIAAVAIMLSTRVSDPAELSDQTRPPNLDPVAVATTFEVVSQVVTFPTTVQVDGVDVTAASADGAEEVVVTGVPKQVGDPVAAGDVIAVLSGRPVIALRGDIPFYRDVLPGQEGPDVLQLRQALVALGYDVVADSMLGAGTQAALTAFYNDRGFEPATAVIGEEARLGVQGAERAVEDASCALDTVPDEDATARRQYERAVAAARQLVADAHAAVVAASAEVPGEAAAAGAALIAARAELDELRRSPPTPAAVAAERTKRQAEEDLATARVANGP